MPNNEDLLKRIESIERNVLLVNKDVFDMTELALYTGFKESYLYKLTSAKQIPHYRPSNGKLFFKRVEIDNWLLQNPIGDNLNFSNTNVSVSKTKKASFKIVLDTRIIHKDSTYSVKLRLIYNRFTKYYPLDLDFNLQEWESISKKQFAEHPYLSSVNLLAKQTLDYVDPFTFEAFESLFFSKLKQLKANDDSYLVQFSESDMIAFANYCLSNNIQPSKKAIFSFLGMNSNRSGVTISSKMNNDN